MNIQQLLFGLLPIFAFALFESFAGLKTALIGSLIIAIAECSYTYFKFGELDYLSWTALLLILVLGGLSYKKNDSKYFKIQPVILSTVLSLFFFITLSQGKYVIYDLAVKYQEIIPNMSKMLQYDFFIEMFKNSSLFLAIGSLIHAAFCLYAAIKLSTWSWAIAKGIAFYLIIFASLIAARIYTQTTFL